MRKAFDFTNCTVNTLYVLEKAPKRPGNGNKYWKVECKACGLTKEVTQTFLLNNSYCICRDFLGKTFDYLTVQSYAGLGSKGNQWNCSCICGNFFKCDGNSLKSKNTTSCGCKNGKLKSEVNISGQVFGRLTALYLWGRVEGTSPLWLFMCDCGTSKVIDKSSAVSGKTKSCGCLSVETSRALILEYHAQGRHEGANNPGWKGGTSSLNKLIRNKKQYIDWRNSVLTRDEHKCQGCGIENSYLNAHHIIHLSEIIDTYKLTSWKEAKACALLWDLRNGIALCEDCHHGEHPELKIDISSWRLRKSIRTLSTI